MMDTDDETLTWKHRAACRTIDPAVFFPPSEDEQQEAVWHAKKICLGCPVKQECFDTFHAEKYGVFGGTSAPDRERIRKGRFGVGAVWSRTRKRFGIPEPRPSYDREAILALADAGLSASEIAMKLDAPRSSVWSIINRQRVA